MRIYYYNPQTGEYLESGTAERDPLEKKETYLIPANATKVKPESLPAWWDKKRGTWKHKKPTVLMNVGGTHP